MNWRLKSILTTILHRLSPIEYKAAAHCLLFVFVTFCCLLLTNMVTYLGPNDPYSLRTISFSSWGEFGRPWPCLRLSHTPWSVHYPTSHTRPDYRETRRSPRHNGVPNDWQCYNSRFPAIRSYEPYMEPVAKVGIAKADWVVHMMWWSICPVTRWASIMSFFYDRSLATIQKLYHAMRQKFIHRRSDKVDGSLNGQSSAAGRSHAVSKYSEVGDSCYISLPVVSTNSIDIAKRASLQRHHEPCGV